MSSRPETSAERAIAGFGALTLLGLAGLYFARRDEPIPIVLPTIPALSDNSGALSDRDQLTGHARREAIDLSVIREEVHVTPDPIALAREELLRAINLLADGNPEDALGVIAAKLDLESLDWLLLQWLCQLQLSVAQDVALASGTLRGHQDAGELVRFLEAKEINPSALHAIQDTILGAGESHHRQSLTKLLMEAHVAEQREGELNGLSRDQIEQQIGSFLPANRLDSTRVQQAYLISIALVNSVRHSPPIDRHVWEGVAWHLENLSQRLGSFNSMHQANPVVAERISALRAEVYFRAGFVTLGERSCAQALRAAAERGPHAYRYLLDYVWSEVVPGVTRPEWDRCVIDWQR